MDMDVEKNKKHIYTVSELNKVVKDLLTQQIGSVWIEGEISNFKYASSGHIYMSIKDEQAQIKVVIFKGISSGLKFQLENGLKVLIAGEMTVYEKNGEYQIIVHYIEPKGVGALQLAFEQLKAKLEKEGLFEQSRKKKLPFLPLKIGIVTSPTGAVIQDMLNISYRRCPISSIVLIPVKVQGSGAAEEIAKAIQLFNQKNCVDVIVIGRGGGSIEDLWAFNEEIVARAIFDSLIPIVSAVGHEVDFAISDFVADLRAPTPSAAMEIILPDLDELRKKLLNFNRNIYNAMITKLQYLKSCVDGFMSHYVFKEPQSLIRNYFQRIDDLDLQLQKEINFYFKNLQSKFSSLADHLNVLSPLNIFSRGYSIATLETGEILKSIKDISKNQKLKTILNDGEIISKVEEIYHDRKKGKNV